jgi:hypothetical protein
MPEKLIQTLFRSYCNVRALAFGTSNQSKIILPEIDSVASDWFCAEIERPAAVSALAALGQR